MDQSFTIGEQQQQEYEASWPEGFNNPLTKKVVTMSALKKHIKVGQIPVYDTTLIYSRVLGLQSTRGIDLKEVLRYELSPVPPSMFEDSGDMRITKTKSTRKEICKLKYLHFCFPLQM